MESWFPPALGHWVLFWVGTSQAGSSGYPKKSGGPSADGAFSSRWALQLFQVVSYGCLQLLVSLGAYPCVLLGLGSSSTDTDVHFSLQQKCDRLLSSLLHLLNVTVKWRAYRKRRKKPLFLSKSLLLLFASAHNYPVLKICTVLFCKVLCALQILLVSAVDQQFTDLEHLWDNS